MLCAVCKTELVPIGELTSKVFSKEAFSYDGVIEVQPTTKANLIVSLYACPQCKRVHANI